MELCGFKIGWRRREGERFERYSSVKRPVLVNTIWNGSRSNLYLGGGKDEEYPVGLLQWAFQSPGAEQHLISSFCISSAVPDYHNRLHCNGIHRKVQERAMKLCQRHNMDPGYWLWVTSWRIDRTPGLPGSNKKYWCFPCVCFFYP